MVVIGLFGRICFLLFVIKLDNASESLKSPTEHLHTSQVASKCSI